MEVVSQHAGPRVTKSFRHHGIMPPHAMTIRLDPGLAEDLATVASVDGKPVTEVVRIAIADHIAARKADSRFRAALREHIGKARRLLGGEDAA